MKMTSTSKRKRGRRSLLVPTLQRKICDLLAAGNSIRSVAQAVGLAPSTFHDWIQRGENGEEKFRGFAGAVLRARGTAKIKLVKVLVSASKVDWRAAAWMLSHCWPEEFSDERAPEPADGEPLPMTIILNTGGKSYKELMDFPERRLVEKDGPKADDDVDDGNVAEESFYELRRRGVV